MPSEWTLEFTTSSITAHAWGPKSSDEFGRTGARLSVILHRNGAVFVAIVGADPSGVLLLNFGQFWLASTYKRWTSTALTYRGRDGGIYLVFPCTNALDGFEECCDKLLPSNLTPCPGPSAQDLYDLGAIPAPRFVGDFLLVSSLAVESAEASPGTTSGAGSEEGSEAGSEVGSEAGSEVSSEVLSELDSPNSTLADLEEFMLSMGLVDMDEFATNGDEEWEWVELDV